MTSVIKYDNHKKVAIETAVIFDSVLSLFNFVMPDDFKNLHDYAKTRTLPYRISFEDICRAIMGGKQKNQLCRLVIFTFTIHPSINLPEKRLQAIEIHIQKRVRELLAIPNAK